MTVVGTAVTLVSAYIALRNVDFAEVWATLQSSDYWWLLPALAAMAVAILVRAVRWRYLFVAERRPALWPLTEALLIGHFFNTVLPARAGDLARVGAINMRAGTSKAEALATVVVERVFDVLALLLLLFVRAPLAPRGHLGAHGGDRRGRARDRLRRLRGRADGLGRAAAPRAAEAVRAAALPARRPARAVRREPVRRPHGPPQGASRRDELLLTVVSWLFFALSFWLVMLCFDFGLAFGAGLLVVIATGFSLALPAAPAGLGVFEAATVVALAAYDVPKSEALSYALVLHAFTIVPFLVAGALVLNLHGVRYGRRVRAAAAGAGTGPDSKELLEPPPRPGGTA